MHSPAENLPFLSALKWNDEGLIPAIVQDAQNGDVLMMAWMDEPALLDTIATGRLIFTHVRGARTGTRGRLRATRSKSSRSGSIAMATCS